MTAETGAPAARRQRSTERFEALLSLYPMLKGVEGDVLMQAPRDMFVAVLADAFHYAFTQDVDIMPAFVEAYQICQDEGLE